MAKIRAKIGEIRAKTAAALEDVPDTLIGTIIFLTVLTAIALGILMVLGYMATKP
jgi:hypothetical protein